MLRLLRSCRWASSKILRIFQSVALVSGRQKAGTPHVHPFFLRPWHLASSPGSEDGSKDYYTPLCCFHKTPMSPRGHHPLPPTWLTPKASPQCGFDLISPLCGPTLDYDNDQDLYTYIGIYSDGLWSQLPFCLGRGQVCIYSAGGESSQARHHDWNLGRGPLVSSWCAFLISKGLAEIIIMVVMGFGVALHNEIFLLPHDPNCFKALRTVVTFVASFSFVATSIIKDFYSETGPKQPD